MKCVKLADGAVMRVKDARASQLVKEGAVYVLKKAWRESDTAYASRKRTTNVKEKKVEVVDVSN